MNDRIAKARAAEETANLAAERDRIAAAQGDDVTRVAEERARQTQSKIDRLHATIRDVVAN